MASNTIIQCTASSSHVMKTYDVFVSFRGEDTRNNFTGFLFEALRRNGIEAFKDNEDLKKGESIAPELLQAIEGSRVFVVVFSKNYASSTWCLRELAQIFNCFESSSRHVLPIFYDVDPAEVRKQSGCYEKAFAQHEERFREDKEKIEEVHRWREYLKHVANLVGWDIRDKPQYAKIEEIAQNIKEKLGSKFSSLPKDNLVGMESRVEELASHLESDNDVRFVGISGMPGVGKTTLARALYEQISHQYDAHCFIDDVSQTYRKYPGALGVQKLLLSQSLKEKNIEICNISEGTQLVFSRLRNAKGLIVFDNVDQVEQLNIFSGSREFTMLRECLGGGSRVIIVSRDEHILKTHGVDDVYKVEPLNREDAIQLFCRKAFKCNYIISDYEELTHDILSHVQGHPLTIEDVYGLNTFNCAELAKREGCSNMCFAWVMQIVKWEARIDDPHVWPWPRIQCIIQGSEIPRWFKSEDVCTDNIMRIDKSAVMNDNDWIGVACSAIFVARNQRGMAPPKRDEYAIPLFFREDIVTVESDHLCLFYFTRISYNYFRRCIESGLKIVGGEGYDVEVKKYGYRFVYEKDLQLSNFTMMRSETFGCLGSASFQQFKKSSSNCFSATLPSSLRNGGIQISLCLIWETAHALASLHSVDVGSIGVGKYGHARL